MAAWDDVITERARQDYLWGQQDHDPFVWLAILSEEVGEAARAAITLMAAEGSASTGDYRRELVQVAAVALAALEALDRHEESR